MTHPSQNPVSLNVNLAIHDNAEAYFLQIFYSARVCCSVLSVQDLSSPRIFKSHMVCQQIAGGPPTRSPAKYIYIARNPKDVVVSMYHHTLAWKEYEFNGSFDEFFDCFADGKVQWGSWLYHVGSWWSLKG